MAKTGLGYAKGFHLANPFGTLPGLEPTPDVVQSTSPAGIQQSKRRDSLELAQALAAAPVALVQLDGGPALVNIETGEPLEDRAAAFAALLMLSAEERNHYAGLLDGRDGATFLARGNLWRSSLRLDPTWMEALRRRSRKLAYRGISRMMDSLTAAERQARRYGWRHRLTLKMLTLTMPHHAGTSSLDEVKRLNMALRLLMRRKWWQTTMAGGIKGVEDALDADGPHVHAHLLILSRFVDREILRHEWRECLELATRTVYGFGLAEDCQVIVDIRLVKRKGAKADELSWEAAVQEITKYITKPGDLFRPDATGRRISRETLLELCEVSRWPRMFELLGRCRKGTSQAQESALAAAAALVSIHRAYLAGDPIRIPKGIGWELVESWDPDLDGPEEKRKLIVEALKREPGTGPQRIRPPSWRALLDILSLPEWLTIIVDRARRGRAFRLRQILEANPSAYLVMFDGKTFGLAPDA